MKPTPKETKKIHENYEKVKKHLIDEKYAVDNDSADKIISGMSQDLSLIHISEPTRPY